jgi:hypothetical protein
MRHATSGAQMLRGFQASAVVIDERAMNSKTSKNNMFLSLPYSSPMRDT